MVISFEYNGKARLVEVQKARAGYVQGYNLSVNDRPAATYTISKMRNISIVSGNDKWVRDMLNV